MSKSNCLSCYFAFTCIQTGYLPFYGNGADTDPSCNNLVFFVEQGYNNRTRIYPPCISKIETVLQPCSYFLIQWLNGTLQYNVSRFNAFGMAGSQIRFYCMVIKHKLLTQAVHFRKGGGCLVSSFPLEVHPEVE